MKADTIARSHLSDRESRPFFSKTRPSPVRKFIEQSMKLWTLLSAPDASRGRSILMQSSLQAHCPTKPGTNRPNLALKSETLDESCPG